VCTWYSVDSTRSRRRRGAPIRYKYVTAGLFDLESYPISSFLGLADFEYSVIGDVYTLKKNGQATRFKALLNDTRPAVRDQKKKAQQSEKRKTGQRYADDLDGAAVTGTKRTRSGREASHQEDLELVIQHTQHLRTSLLTLAFTAGLVRILL